MAKITNPSKLLPSAKTTTITKVGKSGLISPININKKSVAIVKSNDVGGKLVNIEKFLKSDLIISQKKAEVKRKEKQKQNFEAAEKKLETPKSKGLRLPGISAPSLGFLDRVKRFLFFTALGWLLPKILEFLPKLEGFAKIVGGIYKFGEGLFGNLFNGFMSLVKFGGDLKDKTLGFIAELNVGKSANFQKEFDKLEKQFNTFVNASIIAGVLSADIGSAAVDEYNKWRKKNAPEPQKGKKGGKPPVGRPKVTEGRGGKKPTGKPRITGDVKPNWWQKLTGGIKGKFGKVAGKLAGPFSKFAGAAIPGLGAALGAADAKARFESGDKLGGFLAGLSASLDAFTAAVAIAGLGAAATGVGLPGAAVLGTIATVAGAISVSIDVVLLIRDILKAFGVPVFNKGGRVVRRYQGGGTTRGGRPVGGAPRRTIAPVRRKKPPRVSLPKTQPGKDVGGEKKIKEFYAKPQDESKKYLRPAGGWLSTLFDGEKKDLSTFDTLKKMSGTLKSDETLAKGILGLMSSGIDMALGQKPDRKIFKSFFDTIGYVSDTLASQRANMSMSSLMSQLRGFAEGGTVPSRGLRGTYGDTGTGDLLAKLIGPTIDQRVNEAIQSIEKELMMKGKKNGEAPGPPGPPGPDDTPGARLRDGSNAQIEADLLEYFTALYGKNAAIGIVANLRRESGYRTSTPDNSRFEGMAQWSRNARWPEFVKWAESKGLDPYDRNAQAQYIAVELKQLGTDARLKAAKTPEEAASLFYNEFERAAYSRPVVGSAYDPNNPHERKNKDFIQDITGRNPDIGKRSDQVVIRPTTSGQQIGSFASGLYIGSPGDNDGQQTGLNMNLPGGIGTPIYAPVDLIYRSKGTDGNSSVGLNGTPEALGPSGRGFGYYGSYYFTKNGKEYEVLMGHFKDLPLKKSKDGDIIPKGTLIGYQGASGRSISGSGGVYPHISLHVNGVGFKASNQDLVEFANLLSGTSQSQKPTSKVQSQAQRPPGQTPSQQSSGKVIRSFKVGDFTYTEREGNVYTENGKPISKSSFDAIVKNHPSVSKGMQGGGLIAPSRPNRPIPNSFTSYNHPSSGTLVAIQPMIYYVDRPTSSGNGMIAFPVPIAVNSSMPDLSSSRG
jgi:hypothetical protein